jgi:hypothetical protein
LTQPEIVTVRPTSAARKLPQVSSVPDALRER